MSFQDALSNTLGYEGGASDSPYDNGGATIYGISSKAWPDDYAQVKSLVDAGNVDDAQTYRDNFYKKNFWDKIGGDNLSPDMQKVAFDTAVNNGVTPAKKMLAQAGDDPNVMLSLRQGYDNAIAANDPTQQHNLQGWQNRISDLKNQVADSGQQQTDALSGVDLEKIAVPLDQYQKQAPAVEPQNSLAGVDLDKLAAGDLKGAGLNIPQPAPQATHQGTAPQQQSASADQTATVAGSLWDTLKNTAQKYAPPFAAGVAQGTAGLGDTLLRGPLAVGDTLLRGPSQTMTDLKKNNLSPLSAVAQKYADIVSPENKQTPGQQALQAVASGYTGGAGFGAAKTGALAALSQYLAKAAGAGPAGQLAASVVGGMTPAALKGGANATGISAFTKGGQQAAVGSRLRDLATDPDVALKAMLNNQASPIDGYTRSAAVAAQDPGLLAAQKRLQQMNPNDFSAFDTENNAAIDRHVQAESGTTSDLQNAKDERDSTTSPMRQAAFDGYNNDPRLPATQYQNFKADVQGDFDNISDVDLSTKAGQKQVQDLLGKYGYTVESKASNSGKSSVFTATKTDPVTGDPVSFQYRTGANPLPASAVRTGDYIDLANENEGLDALAAKVSRSEPTKPAVNMNYPQGVINRTLQSPEGNTPQVQKSMGAAQSTLAGAINPENPEYAYPLKKAMQSNAQDLLDPTGTNPGAKRMAGGLLKPVMNSLDSQIDKAAPGYADYLAKYHEMSKPIEQMDLLQEASQQSRAPSINGNNPIQAGKWATYFSKNAQDAKNILTSPQMQMVSQVGDELDKGAAMDSVSPATKADVSNLTTGNLLGYLTNGTVRAAASIGAGAHSGGLMGTIVAGGMKGLKWLADMPENSSRELLLQAAKDPALAAKLMDSPSARNLSDTGSALAATAKKMGYGAFVGAATENKNQ